jgi:hypothetical protein
MEKFSQVYITTLAIGGIAILGVGYVLVYNDFFSSENRAQVVLLVSSLIISNEKTEKYEILISFNCCVLIVRGWDELGPIPACSGWI